MSPDPPGLAVVDVRDRDRFELLVDRRRVGTAHHVRRGGRPILVHTEVDPAFEGRGLGGRLAAGVLVAAREAGEPVVPLCPFMAAHLARHPEDDDLVDHQLLRAIDGR